MKKIPILPASHPEIDGLTFRKFIGEPDFPAMLAIVDAASQADHEDNSQTLQSLQHDYQHLTNSDPYQDMIFAEIHGEPIAYARVEWYQEEDPNDRVYAHFVNILPAWREQGIEVTMINWCENRLRTIAESHPQDSKRFYQTYSNEFKPRFNEILKALGYTPERSFIVMSRDLEEIPIAELPEGIKARPVKKGEERKIWEAANEAFRDHWGYSQPNDEHYTAYASSKHFQPELWQVAWDGEEVIASVMNFIDHDYNQKFNRQRGLTENISTRKPWRHRGIAKALIVRSMHMHKALGMTEVALIVDTHNPTGALQLYQHLGYKKDKTFITYRKPL